jgi:hypothetical protein
MNLIKVCLKKSNFKDLMFLTKKMFSQLGSFLEKKMFNCETNFLLVKYSLIGSNLL